VPATQCKEDSASSSSSGWFSKWKDAKAQTEARLNKLKQDTLDARYASFAKKFGSDKDKKGKEAKDSSFGGMAIQLERTLEYVMEEMGEAPLPMDKAFGAVKMAIDSYHVGKTPALVAAMGVPSASRSELEEIAAWLPFAEVAYDKQDDVEALVEARGA